MRLADRVPSDPEDTIWDVVVIGTGAGGGPAGLTLARRGVSVLFLEQGSLQQSVASTSNRPHVRTVAGRVDFDEDAHGWPSRTGRRDIKSEFIVGSGIGGTTAVFSMAMDRFRPVDFTPHRFSHLAPSSTLPSAWPIQYEDLDPYYSEAESLFRVRGSLDPLTQIRCALLDPLDPSEVEIRVQRILTRGGLHPYSLHYAREFVSGCDGCMSVCCPRACKNDAGRVCVIPALENHNAHILPDCTIIKLETDGRSVRRARGLWSGREVAIRGRIFVLALNALSTPALLLRSASESFPDGIGNSSGMVGRNLMTHVSDCITVRMEGIGGLSNMALRNGISLNDFYFKDSVKLGNIHAHAMDLSHMLEEKEVGASSGKSAGAILFFTIVEDFPYAHNRVTPRAGTDDEIYWEYRYPAELKRRNTLLLKDFASAIPGCEIVTMQPSGMLNMSHICGTCRFGDDPRTSVLDRDNKMHDLDNVYVLDASFFPSSGGINPSLTIVANSLRVGSLI